jgi:4-diphosphocytidyl-2-C-methyl-D-erythritol kinase
VEGCLARLGVAAEVEIDIEKRLPVQGGMGAGSANAAAALLGLEHELGVELAEDERLQLAAEVGSDVPLFLVGGAVMGTGRGEQVTAMRDLPKTWCVVAVPQVGVSTPAAFKAWDSRQGMGSREEGVEGWCKLTSLPQVDKLQQLSLAYSSLSARIGDSRPGTSGILRDQSSEKQRDSLENTQEHASKNLAENTLLALVRTGIGNDFEEVVFPQYPSLRITKRQLMGSDSDGSGVDRSAIYAALSGSGSALFGLYRSEADAKAAQQRVQSSGVEALLTETLPRAEYWERMFAE